MIKTSDLLVYCFGQFLVHVTRDGGVCPEIEPEAVARLVGGQ